jgi:hypothetical protein
MVELEYDKLVGRRIHKIHFLLQEVVELMRRDRDIERKVARESNFIRAIKAHENVLAVIRRAEQKMDPPCPKW